VPREKKRRDADRFQIKGEAKSRRNDRGGEAGDYAVSDRRAEPGDEVVAGAGEVAVAAEDDVVKVGRGQFVERRLDLAERA
jgi:hypothetical protein